jgi:hypothetical protein
MNETNDAGGLITTAWGLAQAVLTGRTAAVEALLRERRGEALEWRYERHGQGGGRLTVTGPDAALGYVPWRLAAGPELSEVHASGPDSLGPTYGK